MADKTPNMNDEQMEYLKRCIATAYCEGYNQCKRDFKEFVSELEKPLGESVKTEENS